MFTVLLIIQVLLGLVVIALVLLQQGKGADMGAAFGAGASGTVFGAGGGGSFFTRATAVLAALFVANSLLLSSPVVRESDSTPESVTATVPAAPALDETDLPAAGEDLDLDAMALPPADLPEVPETVEVPETAPDSKSDLPE